MNAIENAIYNEGTTIKTDVFHDSEDNIIISEYVEIDGLTYEFSFFNGEFINITRI